jgi:hypothetical protein
MTQETGKRPNGAAAAILAGPFPRVDTDAYIKEGCLRQFCRRPHFVRHCSRASFVPIRHSQQPFSFYWRPESLALAREAYSGIGLRGRVSLKSALPGSAQRDMMDLKSGLFGF